MIFTVIVVLLVAGIAYFHYAQGFFGATISAVIAVLAAVLAVSYHEPLALALMGGKAASYAVAVTLVAIFALVYILLRTLTDKMIPGQVRLPVALDRVGGGAMGLIAAFFTVGVFALAAQSLPFGPTVGGYARYALENETRTVQIAVPGMRTQQDIELVEQMVDDSFKPESKKSLLIPVDDMVLGLVAKLSDNGSMAGARSLTSIHPNYADELFAQRLGIQIGAQTVATNLPGREQVSLAQPGVFVVTQDLTKTQVDAEVPQIHQREIKLSRPAPPDDTQLVVRINFTKDARDSDNYARLAPGSVRLVANGVNYYPVGTLENGLLYANKMDDFLLLNVSAADKAA
ncbi:MAG: CvpA family protein, partial [Tepidisphaeraceae bacterium]